MFLLLRGYHASTSPNTFLKKRYSSAFLNEAQSRIYPIEVLRKKKKSNHVFDPGRKQEFFVQSDHGLLRRGERIWEAETQEETAALQEEEKEEK